MPEYDHDHVMTWAEYWSVIDPFLALVTLVVVLGLVQVLALCIDLVIRAVKGEGP